MEAVTQEQTTNEPALPVTAMQQKEAVYQLALKALSSSAPKEGVQLKTLVTKEVRKFIRVGLFEGIKNGTIRYSKVGKPDGILKKYCSSIINNWLKKDSRFN